MTEIAKLARELRVGDTLALDVLPARTIHNISVDGDLVVVQSRAPQESETGTESSEYAETFVRDRVVTIETP